MCVYVCVCVQMCVHVCMHVCVTHLPKHYGAPEGHSSFRGNQHDRHGRSVLGHNTCTNV